MIADGDARVVILLTALSHCPARVLQTVTPALTISQARFSVRASLKVANVMLNGKNGNLGSLVLVNVDWDGAVDIDIEKQVLQNILLYLIWLH